MQCSGLSSTLLLAATCVLMTSGFLAPGGPMGPGGPMAPGGPLGQSGPMGPFPPTFMSTARVITCDSLDNVQRLSCDNGVIIVQAAMYGRTDAQICSDGIPADQLANTQCFQIDTLKDVKSRCDGKKVCEISTNSFRTSDPCSGIYKYLDTTYTCFPAIHSVTCDDSLANLQCGEGQVLLIHGADYGRRDSTTCSLNLPASQLQNVQCSKPISNLADSCNGKSNCTVKVSSSVFGDPCFGTYKYLEMAYSCHFGFPDH
uniref:SUEL-type lectin domain-containing protein n=1 Tax=Maylandia zebra TaxID=106582 RepID=A0A3P9DP07_9CICH